MKAIVTIVKAALNYRRKMSAASTALILEAVPAVADMAEELAAAFKESDVPQLIAEMKAEAQENGQRVVVEGAPHFARIGTAIETIKAAFKPAKSDEADEATDETFEATLHRL